MPVDRWHSCDIQIRDIKSDYDLKETELHTGWMLRRYLEQERISDFVRLSYDDRRCAVERERNSTLIRLAATKTKKALQEARKNFKKTKSYVHLTCDERLECLRRLCDMLGDWGECRIFAEAINKRAFSGQAPKYPPFEEAFGQIVTRFEKFLVNHPAGSLGLLVQDNNETVARRLTNLMYRYHSEGTMFTERVTRIIETPLFVNSSLTGMVQIADMCAYATRRYFEKEETDLFNRFYSRFHRSGAYLTGIRHYRGNISCHCRVCQEFRAL